MLEPLPFFFGPTEAPLFGWWHPAAPDMQADIGLILCSPFGFEEVCAHRSLRHLAVAASAAGFSTLRFDYAGCGNSSGDEFDADTWARWIASIHQAADVLKQRSGIRRLCLVGLRLGATLATLAALDRNDVEVLIAIAPIVQGRLYLRELRFLGQTSAGETPYVPAQSDFLEVAGFALSPETTQAIRAVDLCKLAKRPAQRVLIVERDDMTALPDWATMLSGIGVQVRSENWPGYQAMMTDPQRTEIPFAMIANVIAAIKGLSDGFPTAGNAVKPCALTASYEYQESAIRIDAGTSQLFGMLSVGDGDAVNTGIILINSGSVHHIGPNRLWVTLARHWAARGITVLRLDLSGIGESSPRLGAADNVVYSAQAAQDIATALQYMRGHVGKSEIHLLGLCSGAYHAFKAAVAGQRLTSVIMINPLTFFWTLGTPLDAEIKDYEVLGRSSAYRQQLFSFAPWRKLIKGDMDLQYIARIVVRRLGGLFQPYWEKLARMARIPLRNDLAQELTVAARNGVLQRFVFSVGEPGLALLQRQGGSQLGRVQAQHLLSIDLIHGADHTFISRSARERLIAVLDKLVLPKECVP